MPPHLLLLKRGAPVILLRNLNPKNGLCSGTRLSILNITKNLLTVKIMNRSHINQANYLYSTKRSENSRRNITIYAKKKTISYKIGIRNDY